MQAAVVVREATLSDFERIVELEHLCFPKDLAYSRRQLLYLLTKANSTVLVETKRGIIRGFIIILYRRGTRVAGVETINVDPKYRKEGVGLRLLSAAESSIRHKGMQRIRLEVSLANLAALAFYEKAGFKKSGCLKNYYFYDHDGSRDAMRMIKELK